MIDYDKKLDDIEIFLLALRKNVNEGLAMIAAVKQSQSNLPIKKLSRKPKQLQLQQDVADVRMRIATGGRKPRK